MGKEGGAYSETRGGGWEEIRYPSLPPPHTPLQKSEQKHTRWKKAAGLRLKRDWAWFQQLHGRGRELHPSIQNRLMGRAAARAHSALTVGDQAGLCGAELLVEAQSFKAAAKGHEAAVDGHTLLQPLSHVARPPSPLASCQIHEREPAVTLLIVTFRVVSCQR